MHLDCSSSQPDVISSDWLYRLVFPFSGRGKCSVFCFCSCVGKKHSVLQALVVRWFMRFAKVCACAFGFFYNFLRTEEYSLVAVNIGNISAEFYFTSDSKLTYCRTSCPVNGYFVLCGVEESPPVSMIAPPSLKLIRLKYRYSCLNERSICLKEKMGYMD